jgi:hypothetical protein
VRGALTCGNRSVARVMGTWRVRPQPDERGCRAGLDRVHPRDPRPTRRVRPARRLGMVELVPVARGSRPPALDAEGGSGAAPDLMNPGVPLRGGATGGLPASVSQLCGRSEEALADKPPVAPGVISELTRSAVIFRSLSLPSFKFSRDDPRWGSPPLARCPLVSAIEVHPVCKQNVSEHAGS